MPPLARAARPVQIRGRRHTFGRADSLGPGARRPGLEVMTMARRGSSGGGGTSSSGGSYRSAKTGRSSRSSTARRTRPRRCRRTRRREQRRRRAVVVTGQPGGPSLSAYPRSPRPRALSPAPTPRSSAPPAPPSRVIEEPVSGATGPITHEWAGALLGSRLRCSIGRPATERRVELG